MNKRLSKAARSIRILFVIFILGSFAYIAIIISVSLYQHAHPRYKVGTDTARLRAFLPHVTGIEECRWREFYRQIEPDQQPMTVQFYGSVRLSPQGEKALLASQLWDSEGVEVETARLPDEKKSLLSSKKHLWLLYNGAPADHITAGFHGYLLYEKSSHVLVFDMTKPERSD